MVLLGGEAANEVLAKLNWGSINFTHIARRVNLTEDRDCRAWLTFFFLAFLNLTDEPSIIGQFLMKKGKCNVCASKTIWCGMSEPYPKSSIDDATLRSIKWSS